MRRYPTPGPWIANGTIEPGDGPALPVVTQEQGMRANVAAVFDPRDVALISAAPELLAVAKLILHEWEATTDGVERGTLIARLSQYAKEARAAVSKAEGR